MVAQSVRVSRDDAHLIVQPFRKSEQNIVLSAGGGDSIAMPIDRLSDFLVGFGALPVQARQPVLEESACLAFTLAVPELAEGSLSVVGTRGGTIESSVIGVTSAMATPMSRTRLSTVPRVSVAP